MMLDVWERMLRGGWEREKELEYMSSNDVR